MLSELDNFYLQQPEPVKSCLLALRDTILAQDKALAPAWKYSMPFFCYREKMFCYLWIHKKHKQPYIGFVEGGRLKQPQLLQENRSRMKILLIDPEKDLPVVLIKKIVKQSLDFYKKREAKT